MSRLSTIKSVAGVLTFFVFVVGVGASALLVRQSQDVRNQAYGTGCTGLLPTDKLPEIYARINQTSVDFCDPDGGEYIFVVKYNDGGGNISSEIKLLMPGEVITIPHACPPPNTNYTGSLAVNVNKAELRADLGWGHVYSCPQLVQTPTPTRAFAILPTTRPIVTIPLSTVAPSITPQPSQTPSATPTETPLPTATSTLIPTPTQEQFMVLPTEPPIVMIATAEPTVTQEPEPTATIELGQPTVTPNQSLVCAADINQDFFVDTIDYALLVQDFLSATPQTPRADINQDGSVDILDYAILVSQFLQECIQ